MANAHESVVLPVMAGGIGDLTFASPEWIEAASKVLKAVSASYADGLADLGKVTLCEVAHNPPAYLRCGGKLAWHVTFDGASVAAASGELDDNQCDFKIQGDHSIMSNLARMRSHGSDPQTVAAAQARFSKLGRWEVSGEMPKHEVLGAVLGSFHDTMALRTMPRFTFMTPEWVSSARYILSERASKYADDLKDVVFTFSEEFTDTPDYAFPDGRHGGFWVRCNYGRLVVGAGPLPAEYEPADFLTKAMYTPVVPMGRTVNAAMTEEDKSQQGDYQATAFRFDKVAGRRPAEQSQPSGRGPMPMALGRVFMVLHDEMSKRTSGELPSDFDDSIKPEWATPQRFDRDPQYDPSWLNYDKFDIYGEARR